METEVGLLGCNGGHKAESPVKLPHLLEGVIEKSGQSLGRGWGQGEDEVSTASVVYSASPSIATTPKAAARLGLTLTHHALQEEGGSQRLLPEGALQAHPSQTLRVAWLSHGSALSSSAAGRARG